MAMMNLVLPDDVIKDFKKIYAISATAINGIVISEGKPFDVYNLQGRKDYIAANGHLYIDMTDVS